jgi:imidazolonepropionase-like amidohydrolase
LPQKFSDTLFDALISETHKNNLLAVVHSEILADAEYEFNHGADIIAHGWVDRKISDSTLAEWKRRPFAVIPTLLVHCKAKKESDPKSYLLSENEIIEQMGIVHRSGIPLIAGTDAPADGVNYTTDLYAELALYVDAGLTPLEALKTATSNPAKAYKLNERGVIRIGASADFVLVDGDVLKDISLLSRINAVWKQGKQIR